MTGGTLADWIRSYFEYNPETGLFTWRISRPEGHPGVIAGDEAGSFDSIHWNRPPMLSALGIRKTVAHFIWIWMTGSAPPAPVAALNGDTSDLRWDNLVVPESARAIYERRRQYVIDRGLPPEYDYGHKIHKVPARRHRRKPAAS